jgi:hypothetical protein
MMQILTDEFIEKINNEYPEIPNLITAVEQACQITCRFIKSYYKDVKIYDSLTRNEGRRKTCPRRVDINEDANGYKYCRNHNKYRNFTVFSDCPFLENKDFCWHFFDLAKERP